MQTYERRFNKKFPKSNKYVRRSEIAAFLKKEVEGSYMNAVHKILKIVRKEAI